MSASRRIFELTSAVLLLLFSSATGMAKTTISTDPTRDVGDDASLITWAHAVNSRKTLEDSLSGDVDFLEADISMGYVAGREQGPAIPIMAHPPDNSSDLSFESWLHTVISSDTGKGAKLDFKSIETVARTLKILKEHESKVTFPLWLNADVLPGPVNSTDRPVPAEEFLGLCLNHFPNATLSLGWKTYWFSTFPPDSWFYGWNHVRAMADFLKCSTNQTSALTFPVRAVFACRSIPQLQWLLGVFPGSTLTVWSAKHDDVSVDDLLKIRESFRVSEVYYDVPELLQRQFDSRKGDVQYLQANDTKVEWTVVKGPTPDEPCSSQTYYARRTFSFGKNATSAVLSQNPFVVSGAKTLQIKGKVSFFDSREDGTLVRGGGRQELDLVLADVASFSRTEVNKDSDDMEFVWNVMNSSRLHAFEQEFSGSPVRCHYFKLDTSAEIAFQAWELPCDVISTGIPETELMEQGRKEVPRTMRLILPPGPLVFGLISSGNGHAVVHELEIRGQTAEISGCSYSSAASAVIIGVLCASVMVMTL